MRERLYPVPPAVEQVARGFTHIECSYACDRSLRAGMVDLMSELFETGTPFSELGLNEKLLEGIAKAGFEHPTKIQAELIPRVLKGLDVMAQSKTGTGKTVAFGLPIIQSLVPDVPIQSLILVPTRELATQVTAELRNIGQFANVNVTAVYGGQKISIQVDRLARGPGIVVGTPGRVMDMHRRGHLPYDNVRFAVLDEVDEMLDIGFRDDIRKILGAMSHKRQTIFVSATISSEIERLARQYMRDPEKLELTESRSLTVAQVTQSYFDVEAWDKKRLLVHLLTHEDPALTLVFCRTKHTVDGLTEYIKRKGIDAHSIHGDMYQGKRNRVMQQFKSGELSVLVASDLAARGLQVDGISHVINYDLPEDPEIYVHRIGRTARVGREGIAWSLVTPEQGDLLTAIERLTNSEIAKLHYDDFEAGPLPRDISAEREIAKRREDELRVEHSRVPLAPPTPEASKDGSRFPDGLVPAALPAKRLGGRVRLRRR